MRQATGIITDPTKNAAERALDEYQFLPHEISPSTGDPQADNLIAKHLGPLVEKDLSHLVQTSGYLGLAPIERRAEIVDELRHLRREAIAAATDEAPDLFDALQAKRGAATKRLAEEYAAGGAGR